MGINSCLLVKTWATSIQYTTLDTIFIHKKALVNAKYSLCSHHLGGVAHVSDTDHSGMNSLQYPLPEAVFNRAGPLNLAVTLGDL